MGLLRLKTPLNPINLTNPSLLNYLFNAVLIKLGQFKF